MPFDLFISYAHRDNARGQVRELRDAIVDDFRGFAGRDLAVFFDEEAIPSMSDWERRIHQGLRESRLFLAVLSPSYFASEYCRREWQEYVRYEAMRQCLGEGVAPVYFVELPSLDGAGEDDGYRALLAQIRKRQWCDLVSQAPTTILSWHDAGRRALEDQEVARRLDGLKRQLAERLTRADRARLSPTNVYRHNPQFVGRVRELTLLREAMNERGSVGVVGHAPAPGGIVHGLGGMGKTELALAYAHAFAWDYPGGRWLIRCEEVRDIDIALRQLVEPLRIELTEDEQQDARRAADRVLAELARRERSLLLLDNVTVPALLGPDVLMRFPPQSHVHVLATTRLGPTQLGGSPHDHTFIAVDELPADDAFALIRAHQPHGRFSAAEDETAARELVSLLGGFALATETAAIYLGRNAAPGAIPAYVARLRSAVLTESEAAAADPTVAVRHREKLLYRTLAITFETLTESHVAALTLGALLPADQVALPWVRAVALPSLSDTDWSAVAAQLLSLRLFHPAGDDARVVRMHRMVQSLVLVHIRPAHESEDAALTTHVIRHGDVMFEAWTDAGARWEIEPLVATAMLWLSRSETRGARLASAVQWPLQSLARWGEAEALLRSAVDLETRALERMPRERDDRTAVEQQRRLATSLNNLARLLEATHRHREAEGLYHRVLELDAESRTEFDPKVANHMNGLGELFRKEGRFDEAERMFRSALVIHEAFFGPMHTSVARTLNNLGLTLANAGRHSEAEPLLRRSVEAYEGSVGPDHPDVAVAINNLGYLFQRQERHGEAVPLFQRALRITESRLGDGHPHVATCLTNVALSLQATSRLLEAEPLLRRALAIDEASYGPDHLEVATDLNNLGVHLFLQGRLPEAEVCLRRHVEILARHASSDNQQRVALQQSARVYGALLARMGVPGQEIERRLADLLGSAGIRFGSRTPPA